VREGRGGSVGGEICKAGIELARVGSEPGFQPVREPVAVRVEGEALVGRIQSKAGIADPRIEIVGGDRGEAGVVEVEHRSSAPFFDDADCERLVGGNRAALVLWTTSPTSGLLGICE
jgi:hypothetical protein